VSLARVRHLGCVDYQGAWRAMQAFTDDRDETTADELWLLEHPPVYTLGRAGRREHVLAPGEIPVVQVDRGGQVTYHGPGQLVVYLLLDLHRLGLGVRGLVTRLELATMGLLRAGGVRAARREGAPGVYVDGRKVAALGLRVRRGCTYHGLALNVCVDLEPFRRIDPCGYPGLKVTRLWDLGMPWSLKQTSEWLQRQLATTLGYETVEVEPGPTVEGTGPCGSGC
jgi:lipoyl(octanoyl) transferase